MLVFEPRCLVKVEPIVLEMPLNDKGEPMKDKSKFIAKVTYTPECGHIEIRHPKKEANEVEPVTTPGR